jgi:putative membrane protein
MKKICLTTAIILAASTSAFAQSAAETTGANSLIGRAPSTEDFVAQASASDMFEIESSKLALEKGDEATKTFAQQMITDHEKASAELKAMVSAGKVGGTPATGLTEEHKEEVDGLAELSGAEFKEEYFDDQVDAHEDAVDLFRRYAEGGENPELKAWAGKTLPALEQHYKMAQDMDE